MEIFVTLLYLLRATQITKKSPKIMYQQLFKITRNYPKSPINMQNNKFLNRQVEKLVCEVIRDFMCLHFNITEK